MGVPPVTECPCAPSAVLALTAAALTRQVASESPGGLLTTDGWALVPGSVCFTQEVWVRPRGCTSNKFSGETDASGPGPHSGTTALRPHLPPSERSLSPPECSVKDGPRAPLEQMRGLLPSVDTRDVTSRKPCQLLPHQLCQQHCVAHFLLMYTAN